MSHGTLVALVMSEHVGPQHQGTSLHPEPRDITSPSVASVPWTAPNADTVIGVAGQIGTGGGAVGSNPQGDRMAALYAD